MALLSLKTLWLLLILLVLFVLLSIGYNLATIVRFGGKEDEW